MAVPSFEEFVEAVRRSRLVDPVRLAAAVSDASASAPGSAGPTADDLGRRLTKRGLLTDWQRRMLRDGADRLFVVGRYRLVDELGSGGMGSVFLAEHELWGKRAAVKMLEPRRAASPSHLERFLRESRTLAALDHAHVVRVLDCGCEQGRHYLVMEYVEGPTVHDLVRRGGPLPWRGAACLAAQAASGLHYAHGEGFVHRDVKPANILFSKAGGAKVADLGLARIGGEGPSLTLGDGTMVGTVDYLAPEQALDSHNVDVKADVYSLGCTLYFMLSGRPPFPTGSLAQRLLKHQAMQAKPLQAARDDLPLELSGLCERMMAKQRRDRPGMEEVASTLRNLARKAAAAVVATEAHSAEPYQDSVLSRQPAATGSSLGMELHPSPAAGDAAAPRAGDAPAGKVPVRCPHCESALLAPASALGRRAKCPRCGCAVAVESPRGVEAPAGGVTEVGR